jgi:signal transduction histidine kinase
MLLIIAAPAAHAALKQVLVLQSLDRGNLVLDQFTADFRVELDARVGEPVNVVQIVVGPTGFVGAREQAVVDFVRSTYADRPPPDLVVTVGGPAAAFGRRHRLELFPETPFLFAAVDRRFLGEAPLGDNDTALPVANDVPRLIDDILQVKPETRQLFMVIGSGSIGRFWRVVLDRELARFGDRLTFLWSNDMSWPEIVRRAGSLPSHSAIVYVTFGTDALGGAYADDVVLRDLHATANAPMFGALSSYLGHGIVGGSMVAVGSLARRTADVASRILGGAAPRSFRFPPAPPDAPTFDWRELQRWGIDERRLPPGSVVQFRAPSLWDEHKAAVLTAVGVLIFQSLLIAALLVERRARKRAQIDSSRHLALAADANRRLTIAALTSSIAHELTQPLSSIAHNAEALRMAAARGSPSSAATGEIAADIQHEAVLAAQIIDRHRTWLRSHEIQNKPVDIRSVISESLALVAHDMKVRQIEATVDLPPTPCIVDGDQVLLVQVFVNLLRNAIDALAERLPATRRIAIASKVTTPDVEVSVHDNGTGLPPTILGTLFNPFVTTKPNGLGIGLAIVQRIVHAHGGTVAAHANADGGATFTVTLRCSSTRRLQAEPRAQAAGGDAADMVDNL